MADLSPMAKMINNSEHNMAELFSTTTEKLPDIVPSDLSGKVVVVTGANVGIGFETAKAIASMKPKLLILACRNAEKGEEAAKSIKSSTEFQEIVVEVLDLGSYASVKEFAQRFLAKGLPLDTLVSNAGVASLADWIQTKDGHEIIIQVNHIANALLILLLTPALRKAAHPRIVVVASNVHFWARRPDVNDPTPIATLLTKPESLAFAQYPSSKLLNVLFTQEYARRCPFSVHICAANPGYTESQLGSKDAVTGGNVVPQPDPPGMPPKRSTYTGAKTIIACATSAEPPNNGGYYSEMRDTRPRSITLGEEGRKFGERVWKETVELLKKTTKVGFEDWVEK